MISLNGLSTVSFSNLGTDVKVSTTTITPLDGKTYDILYRALWPSGTYTNCVLFNKIMTVMFKTITINTKTILPLLYNIG